MQQCESAHSSDGPLPAAIREVVTAAIEGGATVGEIVARVRARGGEGPGSAAPMDGLICLQRETVRCVEEWERTRDPRAEGLSALIAIETLRTLALRTMAELGQRTEPVPTEDLGRLALALHRIESADRLRIERERAMADAAAHAGPAARAASMTHAERVETVRRALAGHLFPGRTDPPPPESGWAAASAEDSPVTPPEPAPDPACRRASRAFHVSPRRNRRPIRLPTAGRRMYVTRAERRIYVTRAGRAIHGTRTARAMPT